jgi:hypothetical protein
MKRQRGRSKFAKLVAKYLALGLPHYVAYGMAVEEDPAAYIRFIGGKMSSAKEKVNESKSD